MISVAKCYFLGGPADGDTALRLNPPAEINLQRFMGGRVAAFPYRLRFERTTEVQRIAVYTPADDGAD